MFSPRTVKPVLPRFVCALAACLLFVIADSALAQRGGGGRRPATGSGGSKPAQPVAKGPKQPTQSRADEPGTLRGVIAKFEPASDEKDEDLIGLLTVKPVEMGQKSLKLQIRRSDKGDDPNDSKNDPTEISLGEHKFDPELYATVLWKGLYCEVSWDWLRKEGDPENKKPTIRQLKRLTFDTIEVEGKIEEIEGEFLTIKGKPASDREWPELEGKESSSGRPKPTSDSGKTKHVVEKKLRVKVFDDVTKFTDKGDQALDMGDFAVDQQVTARIVYGKSNGEGILVKLSSLTAEEKKEPDNGRNTRPAGPRAQPPAGGPRTRGGGRG